MRTLESERERDRARYAKEKERRSAAYRARWAKLSPEERKAKRRGEWHRYGKRIAARRVQEKRTLVRELKKAPCVDCNGVFPTDVMEYDHLRDKVRDVSKLAGSSRCGVKQVLDEIAKCDLVCANCHRIRSLRRRQGLPAILPPPDYEI